VVLSGQGAPLVPIGDFGLFQSIADGFLNIGGISNISFQKNNKVYAYDISPGNLPLNILIQSIGKTYDENGELAASGTVNQTLFEQLNNLEFYQKKGPKSLGIEWITKEFTPIIDRFDETLANKLATICEHIAFQIGRIANATEIQKLLITGGGALNKYLTNRISHYFSGQIEIPSIKIIEFKEAIIFGFLGVLYLEKKINCLNEVTGARRNSCSGVLHLPN
jgi:anhydro-N-acetylmuramic acid kinase